MARRRTNAIRKFRLTLIALAALGMAPVASAAPARHPGFDLFSYFELDPQTQIMDLHETEGPFLGSRFEFMGTYEIRSYTVQITTSAFFKETRKPKSANYCKADPSAIESSVDRAGAKRYCGHRLWAYARKDAKGLTDQIYLFDADKAAVQKDDRLTVAILLSTSWNMSIAATEAAGSLDNSYVMRGFRVPKKEIQKTWAMTQAAKTQDIFAFSGGTDPREIVSTTVRAGAWNFVLLFAGATLNPLYVIYAPKGQDAPTSLRVTETATASVLLLGSSTDVTEYGLDRVTKSPVASRP